MPHIERARLLSERGVTLIEPSSSFTSTSSMSVSESWPLGPFTVTFCPSTVAVTFFGTGIGFLPIRDIVQNLLLQSCDGWARPAFKIHLPNPSSKTVLRTRCTRSRHPHFRRGRAYPT